MTVCQPLATDNCRDNPGFDHVTEISAFVETADVILQHLEVTRKYDKELVAVTDDKEKDTSTGVDMKDECHMTTQLLSSDNSGKRVLENNVKKTFPASMDGNIGSMMSNQGVVQDDDQQDDVGMGRQNDDDGGDVVMTKCIIENKYCVIHKCGTKGVSVTDKKWGWIAKKKEFGYISRKTMKYFCDVRRGALDVVSRPPVSTSRSSTPGGTGVEVGRLFGQNKKVQNTHLHRVMDRLGDQAETELDE